MEASELSHLLYKWVCCQMLSTFLQDLIRPETFEFCPHPYPPSSRLPKIRKGDDIAISFGRIFIALVNQFCYPLYGRVLVRAGGGLRGTKRFN